MLISPLLFGLIRTAFLSKYEIASFQSSHSSFFLLGGGGKGGGRHELMRKIDEYEGEKIFDDLWLYTTQSVKQDWNNSMKKLIILKNWLKKTIKGLMKLLWKILWYWFYVLSKMMINFTLKFLEVEQYFSCFLTIRVIAKISVKKSIKKYWTAHRKKGNAPKKDPKMSHNNPSRREHAANIFYWSDCQGNKNNICTKVLENIKRFSRNREIYPNKNEPKNIRKWL